MELELVAELPGELREPTQILLEPGGIAELLAHDDLVVDQVEKGLRISEQVGELLQIVLHEDAFASCPAAALVALEMRHVSTRRPTA